MRNPWMSLWLSAANSWAGAMRGLWTAELHRQQAAMANEMIRRTIDFWTRTGMAPVARPKAEASPLTAGSDQRSFAPTVNEAARDLARGFMQTEGYHVSARQRKMIETGFADMKRNLGLTRLRLRGLTGANDEFLLAATVQNLRRLAKAIWPLPEPITSPTA